VVDRLALVQAVGLQEDVLYDVLGVGGLAEDAPGRAEDRGAVVPDEAVPIDRHQPLLAVVEWRRSYQLVEMDGFHVTRKNGSQKAVALPPALFRSPVARRRARP
jgi:hypothetical protein